MITIECTNCRERMDVPDSMVGKTEFCPACGQSIQIINPRSPCHPKLLWTVTIGVIGLTAVIAITIFATRSFLKTVPNQPESPNLALSKDVPPAAEAHAPHRNVVQLSQTTPPFAANTPNSSSEQIGKLTARIGELENTVKSLSDENRSLRAQLDQPPAKQVASQPIATDSAFPKIEAFKIFADKFSKEMEIMHANDEKKYQKENPPKRGDFNEETISVVNCDYKKTDSVINPMVATLVLHRLSYSGNKELLVGLWVEYKYTIQFGYDRGKWVPVKVIMVLEKYESMPQSRYSKEPPTGQEEEVNVKWFAELAISAQGRP